MNSDTEVVIADDQSAAWPAHGTTVGVGVNSDELDIIATAKVKSIAYYGGNYDTDWDSRITYNATQILRPSSGNPLIYKIYLYDIEFEPYPTDSAVTTKRNYTINDARSIISSQYLSETAGDTTNTRPSFSGNILTEYRLFDENESRTSAALFGNLMVSLDNQGTNSCLLYTSDAADE